MFWQEDEDKSLPYQIPDDVIDLNFAINCKTLPLDHAWALSQAILEHLPWLTDEGAGIHNIHVAESNNGWMRPADDEAGALLYPSRRTKMTLRIPSTKLEQSKELIGKVLLIDGHELTVGKPKKKELTNDSVIFSRHVLSNIDESENDFLSLVKKSLDVGVVTDDGVRFYFDGCLVVDEWHDRAAQQDTVKVALKAGKPYKIQIDYFGLISRKSEDSI